ncbi:MAG: bifunctional aspartate kinase/homoserine dehydrogenase I [Bacteroidales bacterium]|nr:bifunctional aspartate kinase/homoserine dehydrogenase I [Bacteroidales bacterium]
MKVLKFGGTSVGTVNSLGNVKAIVEACTEPVIVVVSALGGITDRLIATAGEAAKGGDGYLPMFEGIVDRHHSVIEGIVPEEKRADVLAKVNPLLDELGNIYKGVSLIGDLSSRTLDVIVSYGECISSHIVTAIINDAVRFDSREFIKTRVSFGKHILDNEASQPLIHERFDGFTGKVAVVPGFISTDSEKGEITNLGRGGSDYTAAILAAALDARILEIWTDVDGFMTADPRVIDKAYVIDSMSFIEAMELCNFGAKVIYPPTIYPVFHKNIPILIKNTFNPDAPGTLVSDNRADTAAEPKPIKGISSINDTCLITVTGLGMVGIIGINSRIFNALARHGVSVFMVSQASSENNTSLAVKNDSAEAALAALREEFASELAEGRISSISAQHDLATVAIVGENMKNNSAVAGKLFNTLGRNGISVIAFSQGASETNISFVIDLRNLSKALNVIHDSFFLSQTQVLNLFICGTGTVGRNLLDQIMHQQSDLLRRKALKLQVVGIANSRKALFDAEGIDLAHYEERMTAEGVASSPGLILQAVSEMNIYNPVFIDCTSDFGIAALYPDLLSHNVNVVAANKIAASSPYPQYEALKKIAREKGVKFLFETNVGAGLPIINTINSLRNSGDRILKIEAVLSGTLNFIFNAIDNGVMMSRAVAQARSEGYSEPDPRVDLCGADVVRKLVILARESGYVAEQADVKRELFIPEELFEGTLDDFFRELPKLDATFEEMRLKAAAEGLRYRFVAEMNEHGELSVALRTVGPAHPFYNLEGSNNVIMLTTSRYREYPMIIKGYGAGAGVTAAGVFGDIISIANIR